MHCFDEMREPDGVRPPYRLVHEWLAKAPHERARAAPARGRAALPAHRHHLRGLHRGRRPRAADPLRHHAARARRATSGTGSRAASSSACARSTPSSTTSTTARRSSAPARIPEALVLRNPAFRPEMQRLRSARRRLHPHLRHRHRARRRRTSSTCSRTTAARRPASPTCWRTARRCCGSCRSWSSSHRIAPISHYPEELLETLRSVAPPAAAASRRVALLTPGSLQQRLLRALLPGRRDGRRAGRGRGSLRRRRGRLHAHHRGPEARRRDLPAHRRRLPRSAGLPPGLAARRAGADRAPTAPATSRWPTRSAPASPTTRASTPTCRR